MDDIKRYLPENFYINLQKKALNRSIMSAINSLASYYATMVEDAIDQQFVSSASGKYLLYLGEQYGFSLPPKSGLDITALKILIPTYVAAPKQIYSSFQRLVTAFYTEFKTKPSLVAGNPGPYSLSDGDSLIFESETGRFETVVLSGLVANLSQVDPSELASIINTSQPYVKADTFVDVNSGARYLRLISSSLGVGAYLRVIGGSIQNILEFPDLRGASFAQNTKFLASKDAAYSDVVRLVWDGTGTTPNLFKVFEGDFVTISQLIDVLKSPNSLLNGTYEVIEAGYDYLSFKEADKARSNPNEILAYSQLGSNVISVDYPLHGFSTGMKVNVSSSSDLGGIGLGELSAVETVITVTSPNSFTYQVSTLATSSTYVVLNSVEASSYYYAKSDAEFSCLSGVVTVLWRNHGLLGGDALVGICYENPLFNVTSLDGVVVASVLADSFTFLLPGAPDTNGHYFAIGVAANVPSSSSIVVTSQKKKRIYDQSEYAYVSEALAGDSKVVVPAVPPISRRFLKGAAHLHGQRFPVVDFTRSSLTLNTSGKDGDISIPNTFILSNHHIRPNFSIENQYVSTSSNPASPGVEIFAISDVGRNGIFPHTATQLIGTDSVYAVPGSEDLEITFPFKHGLKKNWEFVLSVSSGSGNLSSGQLSGSHIVVSEIGLNTIKFRALNSLGNPIVYSGAPVSGFDVYQVLTPRADGADFYLQFANPTALTNSGLVAGSVFSVNKSIGTNVFASYAVTIRQCNYTVMAIETDKAYFNVGYGAGPFGLILSGGLAGRSSYFGGTCSYYFDKTSDYNVDYVMSNLFVVPTSAQVSANVGYIGSFLYDPTGLVFPYALSDIRAEISALILKGSSPPSIFVPSVASWPQSGYLYFSYGSSNQEGPVPYRAIISVPGNSQVFIDPSYVFKYTHNVGEMVFRLASLSPLAPGSSDSELPVYLTGTASARETLKALLQETAACGILLDWNVLLPSLRFDDVSIPPYADSTYPSRAGSELGQLPVWTD